MNWNGFFVKKKEMDGEPAGAEFEVAENDTQDNITEAVVMEPETVVENPVSENMNAAGAVDSASEKMADAAESETADISDSGDNEEKASEASASEDASPVNEEKEPEAKPGALCEFDLHVRLNENGDVGRAALYLAMSEDISDEKHVKEALTLCGWKSVATEIGGISGNIPLKASRAIVGAALNSGVVRKTPSEMHALMHAAQEAFGHFIPDGLIECSVGAKIAIVRNSQWLAVAISGDTAYHAVAHHERVGVGVMHI